ncbi:MAG: GntR family transcriptional regulator [Rubrimonas sp.]|uniref:GntR family transcriptional regulator n=1 Tax=Rubrimonas sp. TaxID=2036015 RepID=UPI002FDCC71E
MASEHASEGPAHERVYRALRQRILHGELAPGQALTLRGVAEALGVSMTPAREAVRRLTAERALETTPTGRVLAPVLAPAALAELTEARALLEPELAARALPHADAALIARLRAADAEVNAAIARGDAGGYVRANVDFHGALYAAADAPALSALVESVWLQLNPSMRVITGRAGTAGLVDQHEAALRALEAHDADALRAAIRDDALQAQALIAQLAPA